MILRPGMTVAGKRAVRNPQTVSGFPMFNTYAGLDTKSAAKELNTARRNAGLKGGKSRVHRKRPLARENLAHRLRGEHTIRTDRVRNAFERCRTIGLAVDRCNDERQLDELLEVFELNLDILKEHNANDQINQLLRLESARGSNITLRRI